MTTIAIDSNLELSADTMMSQSDGTRSLTPVTKIFNVHGYRVGFAGRYAEGLMFVDALEDAIERERIQNQTYLNLGEPDFPPLEDFAALVITPDDTVLMYEGSKYAFKVEAPIAIGSGADFAMAAMLSGKSSAEAVNIAKMLDLYSGGETQTLSKEEIEQPPTREELEGMSKEEILEILFGDDDDADRQPDSTGATTT